MPFLFKFGSFTSVCLLSFTCCNYVVSVWRGFLFLWVLRIGCVILLWHSLSLPYNYIACVHGSTNDTNGIPISLKVLPMVPLVIPLVPMVPLVKTDGSQYYRQSTVWAKLPTLESHMIQYGVLNFKFMKFTNKHCFYRDDISK